MRNLFTVEWKRTAKNIGQFSPGNVYFFLEGSEIRIIRLKNCFIYEIHVSECSSRLRIQGHSTHNPRSMDTILWRISNRFQFWKSNSGVRVCLIGEKDKEVTKNRYCHEHILFRPVGWIWSMLADTVTGIRFTTVVYSKSWHMRSLLISLAVVFFLQIAVLYPNRCLVTNLVSTVCTCCNGCGLYTLNPRSWSLHPVLPTYFRFVGQLSRNCWISHEYLMNISWNCWISHDPYTLSILIESFGLLSRTVSLTPLLEFPCSAKDDDCMPSLKHPRFSFIVNWSTAWSHCGSDLFGTGWFVRVSISSGRCDWCRDLVSNSMHLFIHIDYELGKLRTDSFPCAFKVPWCPNRRAPS